MQLRCCSVLQDNGVEGSLKNSAPTSAESQSVAQNAEPEQKSPESRKLEEHAAEQEKGGKVAEDSSSDFSSSDDEKTAVSLSVRTLAKVRLSTAAILNAIELPTEPEPGKCS